MSDNHYTKKLASSGPAAMLFSIFAFAAAGLGILLEPIGYIIHNSIWDVDIGVFSGRQWYTYFTAYDRHLVIFTLSFFVMLFTCGALRKKKLGADLGIIVTALSLLMCFLSIVLISGSADRGIIQDTWSSVIVRDIDKNMRRFDEKLAQLYYVLPLISSGLMFITGITVWIRAAISKHIVETPKNIKTADNEPTELPDEAVIREAPVSGETATTVSEDQSTAAPQADEPEAVPEAPEETSAPSEEPSAEAVEEESISESAAFAYSG